MAMNRSKFQPAWSLPQFYFEALPNRAKNVELPEQARGLMVSVAHVVRARSTGSIIRQRHKRLSVPECRHQATLTAGYILRQPSTSDQRWFPCFYLVGQAQDGNLRSLALRASSRCELRERIGCFRTRSMQAMKERGWPPIVLKEGCRWMMPPWRRTLWVASCRGSETKVAGRWQAVSVD